MYTNVDLIATIELTCDSAPTFHQFTKMTHLRKFDATVLEMQH